MEYKIIITDNDDQSTEVLLNEEELSDMINSDWIEGQVLSSTIYNLVDSDSIYFCVNKTFVKYISVKRYKGGE